MTLPVALSLVGGTWPAASEPDLARIRDFYLYSPLCLALGVGFIALLPREMQ